MSRAAAALLVALLSCVSSDAPPPDPEVPITVVPSTTCRDPLSVWTVLVAADGRSAEARENGEPTRFGVMSCGQPSAPLSASFFRTCGSPQVVDAGYSALFSRRSDGG